MFKKPGVYQKEKGCKEKYGREREENGDGRVKCDTNSQYVKKGQHSCG